LTSSGIKKSSTGNKEIMYLMNFAESITDAPIPRDVNTHTLSAGDNL
jgi:hypothetical protein